MFFVAAMHAHVESWCFGGSNMNWVTKIGLTTTVVAAIIGGIFLLSGTIERDMQFSAGLYAGQTEAESDLQAGRARIYAIGHRPTCKEYDQLSGLTICAIAGCIVNDHDLGRQEGYNQAISDYIQRHGLPPNSRKRWSREILAPVEYMAGLDFARLIKLDSDGDTVKCPTGQCAIQLFFEQRTYPNGKVLTFERLVLIWKDQDKQVLYFPGGDIQNVLPVWIAWGAADSEILFVRYRWDSTIDVKEGVGVLDMRTGLWLNHERVEKL